MNDRQVFGRQMWAQKVERWQTALADYGYRFELVPGTRAEAALRAAQRAHAGSGVTPIILSPGNWNSEPTSPAERIVQAAKEIAATPPTADLGRDYLARQSRKWERRHQEPIDPRIGEMPDLTLFSRLTEVAPKPPESGIYLLKDFLYPSMDRVMWEEVAILHVPTPHHFEVPVYLDWGNWNEVPPSVELAGVARYWEERYDARLIAVGNDQIEFSIGRRPRDFAEACSVFREHFLFGPDPVHFRADWLAQEAANLLLQDTWVFWWD